MPKTYFRQIPDLDYVNRTDDGKGISNYTEVKNLFKRGRLRSDIFQDTTFFEKYQIKGDAVSYTHLTLPTNREV